MKSEVTFLKVIDLRKYVSIKTNLLKYVNHLYMSWDMNLKNTIN